ncbi:hypothetical protein ACWC5I_04735 [Kitasatospora sp. NPDC001574]
MKTRRPEPVTDASVSDSEQFLFGGPLRYDYAFASHEQTMLTISFLTVARQIPGIAVPHRRSGAHDQDEPAPDPA